MEQEREERREGEVRKKEKKELDPSGGGWLTGDLPLRGTVDSARPLSFLVDSRETCP